MTDHLKLASRDQQRRRRRASLVAVKAVHTVVWLTVESSCPCCACSSQASPSEPIAVLQSRAQLWPLSPDVCCQRMPMPPHWRGGIARREHGSVTDIYLPSGSRRVVRLSTRRSSFFPLYFMDGTCATEGLSIAGPSLSKGRSTELQRPECVVSARKGHMRVTVGG
jgi:hypothetical protein